MVTPTEALTECRSVAIIPAYNEERFIASVVLKARKYVDKVIVVDDGSTDATAELAEQVGAIVLRHDSNKGKGGALNTGFRKARELGAQVVALLDGDGQHRPDDIPHMIQPILDGQSDMVVGSRYLELKSEIPLYRRVGQVAITFFTRVSSGVSSTDSWSGYRAFSQRAVQCIHFREGGWGVDPEFQFLAREYGLRVTEVPIIAIYDEPAKRNPIPHGLRTLNAILRLAGQHRPLLVLGLSGLITIMVGFLMGLWVVNRYTTRHELAIGIALLSAMLSIIGTLSLFTGITLHSVRGFIVDLETSLQFPGFKDRDE
jgi:glycosyltransferase involved in cell wall biosynthesis